jgi:hypothetical protein
MSFRLTRSCRVVFAFWGGLLPGNASLNCFCAFGSGGVAALIPRSPAALPDLLTALLTALRWRACERRVTRHSLP